MVRELKQAEITAFIDFGDRIYLNDPNYTPFMRGSLKKTIRKLVFEDQKYKALVSVDEAGNILGRILLTKGKSKQLKSDRCGFFSHFEVIDDFDAFRELMAYAEETVKSMDCKYLVGSFFLDDPDDRRGIAVSGFEYPSMILTSYNPPYYGKFFERAEYLKLTDTFEYKAKIDPKKMELIEKCATRALERNNLYVSPIDLKNIEREIKDVHEIMTRASTAAIFEEVPSEDEIRHIFEDWKSFIHPDFAPVVRRKEDDSPVGFTLSIPDYNELIRKMNGRINPKSLFVYLTQKNKIYGLRGMLQYVVPEYQRKGVILVLYHETKKAMDKHHIQRMTLGTITEMNASSNGVIQSAGGELSRIYRVYYKELDEK